MFDNKEQQSKFINYLRDNHFIFNDNQSYTIIYDDIWDAYNKPSKKKVNAFKDCVGWCKDIANELERILGVPVELKSYGVGRNNCQVFTFIGRFMIYCENGCLPFSIKDTHAHFYWFYE